MSQLGKHTEGAETEGLKCVVGRLVKAISQLGESTKVSTQNGVCVVRMKRAIIYPGGEGYSVGGGEGYRQTRAGHGFTVSIEKDGDTVFIIQYREPYTKVTQPVANGPKSAPSRRYSQDIGASMDIKGDTAESILTVSGEQITQCAGVDSEALQPLVLLLEKAAAQEIVKFGPEVDGAVNNTREKLAQFIY